MLCYNLVNILIQNFLLVNYVALTFYRPFFTAVDFFFSFLLFHRVTHSWDTRSLFDTKRRRNPEGEINKVPAAFWGRVSTFIPTISVLVPLFFSPGSKFNSQLSNYVATLDLIKLQLRNLITLRYLITENWRSRRSHGISLINVFKKKKKYRVKEYLLIFLLVLVQIHTYIQFHPNFRSLKNPFFVSISRYL